jgi:hypothetical protein
MEGNSLPQRPSTALRPAFRRRWAERGALALLSAASFFVDGAARAEPTTSDRAIAEQLYDRGREQLNGGRVDAACESFAESQRLDPGTGTLLNLAACHEADGRLASAWVEFREALAASRRENRPDRVRYALDHLEAIEPRLATLTLVVPEAAHGNAPVVTLDGRVLGPAAWGLRIPLDAGWHEALAQYGAGGTWHATIKMMDGQRRTLTIPASVNPAGVSVVDRDDEAAAGIAKVAGAKPASPARTPSTRIVGLALAATGVAALGVGGYFTWRAANSWHDRNRECPMEACTPEGVRLGGRADSAATVATWTITGGAVALGAGALLLLWPRGDASAERASASAGPPAWARVLRNVRVSGPGSLSLGGTF